MRELVTPNLRRRILRNPLCSKVLKTDREVYVVGGYLRDLISTGTHSRDIDFAIKGDMRSFVKGLAASVQGRAIELKKEKMLRIVTPKGRTLDFTSFEKNIEKDLRRRDFTVNALAWSPQSGLIDPCSGLADIKRRTIRSTAKSNLIKDPLRLLRAFRLSCELNMAIERSTRHDIIHLARRISTPAHERITSEVFKLLNCKNPYRTIGSAMRDGLLSEIIPLTINRLRKNLKLMSLHLSDCKKLPEKYRFKEFSQGLTSIGLLRLETLMLGCRVDDALMRFSSNIRKRVELTNYYFNTFAKISKLSDSEIFDLLHAAGDAAGDLLVISGNLDMISVLKRFNRISAKGLLSTDEIMKTTGVSGGARLGQIIRELGKLQFIGRLSSKGQAMRWISDT